MTETTNPCFCEGPWHDDPPEDRPESRLDREHERGSDGCYWPRDRYVESMEPES